MSIVGTFPKSGPRPTESHAERRVHEALSRKGGLPKGMIAWHSLAFTWEGNEIELDFVVAHPQRGFLVLEVKGGQITLEDGRWHQNGRLLEGKSPPAQARAGAHALKGWLQRELGAYPSFAYALWFPEMSEPIPIAAGDAAGRLLGAESLAWSAPAIGSAFDQLVPKTQPRKPFIRALHTLWGESSPPSPVRLGTQIDLTRLRRTMLDASQLTVLDAVSENPRLLVEGGAGTGKTQLALLAAHERAERGEIVLLTCFTEGLARRFEAATRATPNIEVGTVRELAAHLALSANVAPNPRSSSEWQLAPVAGALALLSGEGPVWDAVILDEAQDLEEEDWDFIRACLREDERETDGGRTRLWAFADPAQAFWPERVIPQKKLGLMHYQLGEGHRVPRYLMALADAFSLSDEAARVEAVRAAAGDARGDSFELITAPLDALDIALEKELARLIHREKVPPRDIAIISLRGQNNSGTASLARVGDVPVSRVSDPEALEQVVQDTFLRFKGLERPVIFVTNLDLVENRVGLRMQIALTRALERAIVIASDEAAERHGLI